MKRKFGSRQVLLLVVLIIVLLMPHYIKTPYILSICIMTFYMASASLSWSVLGGLTGQTSLGHAGFMGLGAYVSTMLLINFNVSPWISIPIVFLVVGALAALLLSPCFGLRGTYFTLVTIAFAEAFRNLFTNWDYAGKGGGLLLPFGATDIKLMRFMGKTGYFYLSFGMVALIYIIVRVIDKSKLGYGLKTVREDEDTANAIGINPWKYKVIATFISCGLTAICGVFYANYYRFIDPEIMLQTQSLEYVMPALIGGIGSVTGPLLGAVIITPISQFLNATLSSIASGFNQVVYAIILIVVILFQPKGIMGWFNESKLKMKVNSFFDSIDNKLFGKK